MSNCIAFLTSYVNRDNRLSRALVRIDHDSIPAETRVRLGGTGNSRKNGTPPSEALAPEIELHDLIIELRSHCMGLGSYRHQFDHLAEARRRMERGVA